MNYLCIDFIHMSQDPHCPQCNSEYPYPSGDLWICPECAHEWSLSDAAESDSGLAVRDANGNLLQDGDSVTVIKDLPVKGFSKAIKVVNSEKPPQSISWGKLGVMYSERDSVWHQGGTA